MSFQNRKSKIENRNSCRGMMIVEVLACMAVLAVVFGAIMAAMSAVHRGLHAAVLREQRAEQWMKFAEILRDDLRAARQVEWLVPDKSPVNRAGVLRVTRSDGAVAEYESWDRKLLPVVPAKPAPPAPPPPPPGRRPAPAPKKPPPKKPSVALPKPPPPSVPYVPSSDAMGTLMRRRLLQDGKVIATWEQKDAVLEKFQTSKAGSAQPWDLADVAKGTLLDASKTPVFLLLTFELRSSDGKTQAMPVAAATRGE